MTRRIDAHCRAVSSAAMAAFLALSAPALAQEGEPAEQPDDNAESGNVITVTAQFREQNLQDTPIAITALNAEMIEARGQTSLAEIGATAPNVSLRETPATFGPAVSAYIRGVGQHDSNFALEPGVGIYIDDVYFPTLHGSMIQLVDLERVEILRGPQGTLAGQNSIGGAIKLYAKKPRGDGSGYVEATYGSYDRMELRAAADFALTDTLFARVSGASARREGYITRYDYACTHPGAPIRTAVKQPGDCKLGTDGGKDYIAGRLALRWEPTDRISLDVVGDVVEDESEIGATTLLYVGRQAAPGAVNTQNGAGPAYVLNGVPYGNTTGSPFISYSPYGNFAQDTFSDSPYISYEDYSDLAPRDGSPPYQAPRKAAVDSWGVSANLEIEISDSLNLASITGYREYSGLYTSGEGSPFATTSQINRVLHEQFSQELRLWGEIGEIVNWTVGGFYLDRNGRNPNFVTLPALMFTGDNFVFAETKAVFANVEVRPIERLTLVGGLRYSDQEKSFRYGRFPVPGSTSGVTPPSVAGLNGVTGAFEGKRWDYRAVAQYSWTDDLMTYVQYSTGFKGGGVNPRPFFPQQVLPHDSETLQAYEAGFKSSFLGRAIRLNGAAFLNKYDDILVTVSNCPLAGAPAAPCGLPLNAGKADVKGIELELNAEPIEGLLLDASLAYLDFDYKAINPVAVSSGIGLEDNGPYIQEWQWSAGAQYSIDLGGAGTLTPRLDAAFEDDFNRNANNVDGATGGRDIFGRVEDRLLVNARLTYRTADEDWQVAIEVKNLTDKLYYSDVFDNRGSTASIQGVPGMPRTWAVSLRHNFD
jgi:iron complex outermembrane receptor protein